MKCETESPLVSAIITTYNRQAHLKNAIQSVLKQSYESLELIVVDDSSPQSPESIVKETTSGSSVPVEFIEHKENKGASAARNTGIEAATGDFVAFLDDDEVWVEDKIKKQVNRLLATGPEVGAIYSGIKVMEPDGSLITVRSAETKGDMTKQFLCGKTPAFPSIVVRRDILKTAGTFNESFPSWNDREWLIRVAQECEFEAIDEPLVVSYREDGRDRISHNFDKKRDISYPGLVEKSLPIAEEYGWLFKKKVYGYITFELAYSALGNHIYDEARKYFALSLIRWPFNAKAFIFLIASISGKSGYRLGKLVKRKVASVWEVVQSKG